MINNQMSRLKGGLVSSVNGAEIFACVRVLRAGGAAFATGTFPGLPAWSPPI